MFPRTTGRRGPATCTLLLSSCVALAAAAGATSGTSAAPGPGAADTYNDFAFALPGGAKESYFELKSPLIAARLSDLAPLWEMES